MHFPGEIIEEIYSHLGNTDKQKLRQTSKYFQPIKLTKINLKMII